jgi:diguanylate cyclase (GGDEF)-like protein/PAS domain S-box-containing protein
MPSTIGLNRVGADRRLFDHVNDGVYFVDTERRITYWNKAAERLTGYRADEVLGKSCRDDMLVHVDECGRCICRDGCPLAATIDDGRDRQTTVYLKHKLGHRLAVRVRATPLVDDDGEIVGAAELFNVDRSSEAFRQQMYELQSLAFTDPLTRLANRQYLEQSLSRQMTDAAAFDWRLGLILIDVDHMRKINDTFTHAVGDRVLEIVAHDIVENLRSFDIAGRFGADRFLVMQPHASCGQLLATAERIRMLIDRSHFHAATGRVKITASVGATLIRHGDTDQTVIDRLTTMMKIAKESGGNRVFDDLGHIDD